MIELRNIRKQYYNITALDNVSLVIPQGSLMGILGPNGAGKSTLFKIIAGLIFPDSGAISAENGLWPRLTYKPDRLHLPAQHTVEQYMHLVAKLANIPPQQIKLAIIQALESVNLNFAQKKKVGELSKGMKQRLGLAQALLGDPPLLLLDEPSDGLDPIGQEEMQKLLRQLHQQGKTILLSSHQLPEIAAVCDRIAILSNGQLRYTATMNQALALRPQVTIRVDRDLAPIRLLIRQTSPHIIITENTLTLEESAVSLRRHILTLLLGAGYDILHMDRQQRTLADIYKEALQ